MYIVVGTGDGEISVWNAAQTEPICRLNSSGDNRILDISWHDSGSIFFACGSNGIVYFGIFEKSMKILNPDEFLTTVMNVFFIIKLFL